MKRIDAGISGAALPPQKISWVALDLDETWVQIINTLQLGSAPRPIQVAAFGKQHVLDNRRNIIISAPTNSGKSLIGLLVLLEAVRRGKRAVLLEPLRAIAREKYDELHSRELSLAHVLGATFNVRLTTGDYRLDDETFSSPPPQQGELIIATPERLEAILRNPENSNWIDSIGAVCVDEAHLINSPRRGTTLEYLVTSLLCVSAPPRIVFLSATLGETEKAQAWLAPCDVIRITDRQPPLRKEIIALDFDEDVNQVVYNLARFYLSDPQNNLLVFVYQTRSAESLARQMQASLSDLIGPNGVAAYHSRLTTSNREQIRNSFMQGQRRCLVTTTALGLGVNLPATHVIIRDTTFPGVGRLSTNDLLQMMGRAGRGDQHGHALAMVRKNDGWEPDDLAHAIAQEKFPELISPFEQAFMASGWQSGRSSVNPVPASNLVAIHLARLSEQGQTVEQIKSFFTHSLGGHFLVSQVDEALNWLREPQHLLAWRDEKETYRLTALGIKAIQSVLPLELACGVGQLIRDLLTVDSTDQFVESWRPLDHLIVLNLLYENMPTLRPYSNDLAHQVDAWMEQNPLHIPLLYREWIAGEPGHSRAAEVLGSLGLVFERNKTQRGDEARKIAYKAVFHSIVLYQHGLGITIENLERQWKVKGIEGVEERWRDDYLWLLNGLGKILELRCFYFHLRENCAASDERTLRVKKIIDRIRWQTLDLQEHIKYCSPLGPLLRSLKRMPNFRVGIGTIRRLEDTGILNLKDITLLSTEDLVKIGIRRNIAEDLRTYVRRRLT